ncbi:hypothetical protein GCM10022288_15020 [Gryllotalpicola kribbensis]|uniref:Pycsar effector protein domain-containing protein n=1 Tax=Gryllotalpicola kribbensis TaxID=993084 RepID=A0ABP8AR60_9MICO
MTAPDEEFAWRVHDSISEWTARVDVKASISLAIEAAVLGFIVTLATDGRVLEGIANWTVWLLWGGVALLLASVVLSILAVLPQLRRRHMKSEYRRNRIFFGHLRLWDPDELAKSMVENDELGVAQLARQLVSMSKIAWLKHVWLQASLYLMLLGIAAIAALFVLLVLGCVAK